MSALDIEQNIRTALKTLPQEARKDWVKLDNLPYIHATDDPNASICSTPVVGRFDYLETADYMLACNPANMAILLAELEALRKATQWQPVVGYETIYEVSEEGIIRSTNGSIVGQWVNSQGYLLARLSNPRAVVRVHRVVAEAFLPNRNKGDVVNHLDFNPKNNCKENLEWCTQGDNVRYSKRANRYPDNYHIGKRSVMARLSEEEAELIRKKKKQGISTSVLCTEFNTNRSTVNRIAAGKSYLPLSALPKD